MMPYGFACGAKDDVCLSRARGLVAGGASEIGDALGARCLSFCGVSAQGLINSKHAPEAAYSRRCGARGSNWTKRSARLVRRSRMHLGESPVPTLPVPVAATRSTRESVSVETRKKSPLSVKLQCRVSTIAPLRRPWSMGLQEFPESRVRSMGTALGRHRSLKLCAAASDTARFSSAQVSKHRRSMEYVFRLEVVRASLIAVWEMSLFLMTGYLLHRTHILDPQTVQGLSKAVYHIFLPALCFVNISAHVASSGHTSMLPLFFAAFLHIIAGIAAGELLSALLKVSSNKRRFIRIACGFGNSTSLPGLFYSSIFASDPSRATSSLGLMSIYCITWTAAFWPYLHANFGAPNVENAQQLEGTKTGAPDMDPQRSGDPPKYEATSKILHSGLYTVAIRRIGSLIHALGTPPAFASIIGLLCGLVAPLRNLLFQNNHVLSVGLVLTVKSLAAANGACAMLVLAASLASRPGHGSSARYSFVARNGSSTTASHPTKLFLPLSFIVGLYQRALRLLGSADFEIVVPALITRCILLPCLTFALIFPLADAFGLIPAGPTGTLMRFVMILQAVMPPAQNIVVGLQLEGDADEAAYAGRQLLVTYLLSLIPLCILLTLFLGILNV
jgi:predicted permease